MKAKTVLPFLACALAFPILAEPITYEIDFTLGGVVNTLPGGQLPTSGSFTYDPAIGFTSFIVMWNGNVFDLTASANAPMLETTAPFPTWSECNDVASSPGFGFLIMSHTVTGCPLTYEWDAYNGPGPFASFGFWEYLPYPPDPSLSELTYIINTGTPSNSPPINSAGQWSITAVPEPTFMPVLILGIMLLPFVQRNRRS